MSESSLSQAGSPDPTAAAQQQMPAAPGKYDRLKKVFYGLVSFLLLALSILKFVTRNDLPGCDYGKTRDLLATIFKNKNVEYKKLNDATTVSTTDDLIVCKSSVTMSDGTMLIDYQISRQPDDKFEVSIVSARAQ